MEDFSLREMCSPCVEVPARFEAVLRTFQGSGLITNGVKQEYTGKCNGEEAEEQCTTTKKKDAQGETAAAVVDVDDGG